MKTVSRFEYAIDQYINDNIAPRDMSKICCKTQAQEDADRRKNIDENIHKLVDRIKRI